MTRAFGPVPAPAVSVLMPYRNAHATLRRATESVLAQNLRDFELLAIDDGSCDEGPSLMRVLGASDPRIRALRAPSAGLVAALGLGLQAARAAFVARMDADDWMHPRRLAAQLGCLVANPDLALVACRVRAFPSRSVTGGMKEYLRWQDRCLTPDRIRDEIYVESPFVHPSVMMRRDWVLELGGYRAGAFPEDYDLWLRLAQAGASMAKLPERLLAWRLDAASASRTDPRYSRPAFDALRSRYLAADPRLRARPLAIWGAGRRTRKRVAHLLAQGLKPSAWIDIDPRKIGNRLDGVSVVAPQWLQERGPARPFVLAYVASHGAREAIARELGCMGYRQGRDFLPVG